MLLKIPQVLTAEQVAECRAALEQAEWVDGRVTAGHQSGRVKNNQQLPEDHPVARQWGEVISQALVRNMLFRSAALPAKIYPPLFNRYSGGGNFGVHVDNAVRDVRGTPHRVRTDISATLFLVEPDEYEGGELVVEDTYGAQSIKFAAGDMVLYPGTSLHRVNPVTQGTRLASFFWIQSLVREDSQRSLLFDMDTAIQRLAVNAADHPSVVQLTGVYHNLLRRWVEV
ncbi:Fe2+-dependent dioxygenase [Solimonas fluminis]|jgi:PKHD-type hydroxylase|uniref:Fe2+-dependent dioxygenase n=1 Tax=Solimonas fluminis TaxID=2086571 RepID=A0A2S5TC44_9GAMM|nr:Fe2+-dependent dioxygenase [Solimonas fluminis]PPE72388.1 Fe2+-dependent dioxygenase [Solimonas fluminis]